jgi:hypothetical protein
MQHCQQHPARWRVALWAGCPHRCTTALQADNEVAFALYKGCGFAEHSSEAKYDNAINLGRLVLLRADSSQVPAPA